MLRAVRKWFIRRVLQLGWISKGDREEALLVFDDQKKPKEDPWQKYMEDIVDTADRNRIYLHASRVLGVFAAFFIAALAIVAVIAGTVAPAPSDVVVVYHGRFRCVPVGDYAKYTGVTQVISVSSC